MVNVHGFAIHFIHEDGECRVRPRHSRCYYTFHVADHWELWDKCQKHEIFNVQRLKLF